MTNAELIKALRKCGDEPYDMSTSAEQPDAPEVEG